MADRDFIRGTLERLKRGESLSPDEDSRMRSEVASLRGEVEQKKHPGYFSNIYHSTVDPITDPKAGPVQTAFSTLTSPLRAAGAIIGPPVGAAIKGAVSGAAEAAHQTVGAGNEEMPLPSKFFSVLSETLAPLVPDVLRKVVPESWRGALPQSKGDEKLHQQLYGKADQEPGVTERLARGIGLGMGTTFGGQKWEDLGKNILQENERPSRPLEAAETAASLLPVPYIGKATGYAFGAPVRATRAIRAGEGPLQVLRETFSPEKAAAGQAVRRAVAEDKEWKEAARKQQEQDAALDAAEEAAKDAARADMEDLDAATSPEPAKRQQIATLADMLRRVAEQKETLEGVRGIRDQRVTDILGRAAEEAEAPAIAHEAALAAAQKDLSVAPHPHDAAQLREFIKQAALKPERAARNERDFQKYASKLVPELAGIEETLPRALWRRAVHEEAHDYGERLPEKDISAGVGSYFKGGPKPPPSTPPGGPSTPPPPAGGPPTAPPAPAPVPEAFPFRSRAETRAKIAAIQRIMEMRDAGGLTEGQATAARDAVNAAPDRAAVAAVMKSLTQAPEPVTPAAPPPAPALSDVLRPPAAEPTQAAPAPAPQAIRPPEAPVAAPPEIARPAAPEPHPPAAPALSEMLKPPAAAPAAPAAPEAPAAGGSGIRADQMRNYQAKIARAQEALAKGEITQEHYDLWYDSVMKPLLERKAGEPILKRGGQITEAVNYDPSKEPSSKNRSQKGMVTDTALSGPEGTGPGLKGIGKAQEPTRAWSPELPGPNHVNELSRQLEKGEITQHQYNSLMKSVRVRHDWPDQVDVPVEKPPPGHQPQRVDPFAPLSKSLADLVERGSASRAPMTALEGARALDSAAERGALKDPEIADLVKADIASAVYRGRDDGMGVNYLANRPPELGPSLRPEAPPTLKSGGPITPEDAARMKRGGTFGNPRELPPSHPLMKPATPLQAMMGALPEGAQPPLDLSKPLARFGGFTREGKFVEGGAPPDSRLGGTVPQSPAPRKGNRAAVWTVQEAADALRRPDGPLIPHAEEFTNAVKPEIREHDALAMLRNYTLNTEGRLRILETGDTAAADALMRDFDASPLAKELHAMPRDKRVALGKFAFGDAGVTSLPPELHNSFLNVATEYERLYGQVAPRLSAMGVDMGYHEPAGHGYAPSQISRGKIADFDPLGPVLNKDMGANETLANPVKRNQVINQSRRRAGREELPPEPTSIPDGVNTEISKTRTPFDAANFPVVMDLASGSKLMEMDGAANLTAMTVIDRLAIKHKPLVTSDKLAIMRKMSGTQGVPLSPAAAAAYPEFAQAKAVIESLRTPKGRPIIPVNFSVQDLKTGNLMGVVENRIHRFMLEKLVRPAIEEAVNKLPTGMPASTYDYIRSFYDDVMRRPDSLTKSLKESMDSSMAGLNDAIDQYVTRMTNGKIQAPQLDFASLDEGVRKLQMAVYAARIGMNAKTLAMQTLQPLTTALPAILQDFHRGVTGTRSGMVLEDVTGPGGHLTVQTPLGLREIASAYTRAIGKANELKLPLWKNQLDMNNPMVKELVRNLILDPAGISGFAEATLKAHSGVGTKFAKLQEVAMRPSSFVENHTRATTYFWFKDLFQKANPGASLATTERYASKRALQTMRRFGAGYRAPFQRNIGLRRLTMFQGFATAWFQRLMDTVQQGRWQEFNYLLAAQALNAFAFMGGAAALASGNYKEAAKKTAANVLPGAPGVQGTMGALLGERPASALPAHLMAVIDPLVDLIGGKKNPATGEKERLLPAATAAFGGLFPSGTQGLRVATSLVNEPMSMGGSGYTASTPFRATFGSGMIGRAPTASQRYTEIMDKMLSGQALSGAESRDLSALQIRVQQLRQQRAQARMADAANRGR